MDVKEESLMGTKRAQVSMFILLGLLLLLVVGITVYLNQTMFAYPGLSAEMRPVVQYLETCVEETTLQGALLASMQGGYLDIPQELSYNPDAHTDLGVTVPHWYVDGKNTGPALGLVEEQLSQFIQDRVMGCVDSFKSLEGPFSFRDFSVPQVNVRIHDTKILVDFALPVKVFYADTEQTLPKLNVKIDHDLGKKHRLATIIMYTENKEQFLELLTDEVIASSDYLPYDGMEFTCTPRIWLPMQIQQHVSTILEHNLPRMYFTATDHTVPTDPYYKKIYKVDLGNENFREISVKPFFPRQTVSVDAHPKKNGKITNLKLVADTFALPCVKVYHHKYDVEYSVVFELQSENGNPFYFSTPVMVKRNEPNRKGEVEPWPSEILTVQSKAFCERDQKVSVYTTESDGTIVSTPSTAANWEHAMQIYAVDDLTGQLLSGAKVSYLCGTFACEVGETTYGGMGIPSITDEFPTCLNGKVLVEKEGYLPAKEIQTVDEDTAGAIINVPLTRLLPYDYAVNVFVNHNDVITERLMEDGEVAVITVTNEEFEYDKTVVFPPSAIEGGEELGADNPFAQFELIGAEVTYVVDVKMMKNEEYKGSYEYNWTPVFGDVMSANYVEFPVMVKDTALPPILPEDFQELFAYAQEASKNYSPVLRMR